MPWNWRRVSASARLSSWAIAFGSRCAPPSGSLTILSIRPIAFGLGHAEVAHRAFLGVAALLVADHHAGLAIEARQTADDRLVVREGAVAVQLMEIGEDRIHVVHCVRTLRMACDLGDLPRRQLGIDVFRQLLALFGQAVDFFRNIDGRIVLHEAKFFNLGVQLGDRLLKTEESCFTHCTSGLFLAAEDHPRGGWEPRKTGARGPQFFRDSRKAIILYWNRVQTTP